MSRVGTKGDLAERLGSLALSLVETPSVSGDEQAVLGLLRAAFPGDPADDADSCLLYLPERRPGVPLVLLAAHVDTVPIAGSSAPRRDARTIHGRGASDMKGACAVMVELALDAVARDRATSTLDVGFCFFGREELAGNRSALIPLLSRVPDTRAVDLAVVMEPTANAIEVGCLGNLDAVVTAQGTAAHSARPWLGHNAIHRAIGTLGRVVDLPVRDVEIDGLTYREVVNVTMIEGGIAANVIPDRATARVNFRFAPSHTAGGAEARLRELLGAEPDIDVEVVSCSPPGPVVVSHPLVTRLREAGGLRVGPKQAWTPVAEFGQVGIPAINFGPGDPEYAHRDDERVEIAALVRSYEVLRAFLDGSRAEEV